MNETVQKHKYIGVDDNVCNGSPVIDGTRIRVQDIAVLYEYSGKSPDEIIQGYPELSLPAVHDALSYYYAHQNEIDRKIREDREFVNRLKEELSDG